jgi:hypothetical protein
MLFVPAGELTLLLPSSLNANVSVPLPLAVIVSVASSPSPTSVPAWNVFSLHTMCASVSPTVDGSSPLGNASPKLLQLQFVPNPSGAAALLKSGLSSSPSPLSATSGAVATPPVQISRISNESGAPALSSRQIATV